MKQSNLGTFFGGNKTANKDGKTLAEKKGVNPSSLKRGKPTLGDIDKEFDISKSTQKLAEQNNLLFNVALVPPKVNLISKKDKSKLRCISDEDYRPDTDCEFSLKYVKA
jgi:hypothetical protein